MENVLSKFKKATDLLSANGIDYLVFGGIAVWAYGRRRKTRDIDLLIRRQDAQRVLKILKEAGFYTEETDKHWIYKAAIDGVSIDLIFEAKGEFRLTPEILARKQEMKLDNFVFQIIDPENLLILKILAKKEIRPADWYDGLSMLFNLKEKFDWNYFQEKAKPYAVKVLSFLFFAQAEFLEHEQRKYVPDYVIENLFYIYKTTAKLAA